MTLGKNLLYSTSIRRRPRSTMHEYLPLTLTHHVAYQGLWVLSESKARAPSLCTKVFGFFQNPRGHT